MSRKHTILVVDDEEFVRESLGDLLESDGYRVDTAASSSDALAFLKRRSFDVVVTDLSMPGGDGLDLLRTMRKHGLEAPVIVLTGVGKVADAVAAMKEGAYDFLQKPVDPDQFSLLVARAIEHRDLVEQVHFLEGAVRDLRGPVELIGASPAFESVRALVRQVAPTDATVMVTGESGTGKELIAAEIHRLSERSRRNLVCVNCSAVSENLFESEFFGHRRGAFTGAVEDRAGRFAEAESGTLVLDEISTLDPAMQAKLLRVLETGEYAVVGESRTRVADVRVIAISNEDLQSLVGEGRFRADLFYRLNVFPVIVPPLRERKEDIPLLARYLFSRIASHAANGETLSEECMSTLSAYDWPGNVRELRNLVERAAILSGKSVPNAALFAGILGANRIAPRKVSEDDLNIRRRVAALERQLVVEALSRAEGKREAADLLGIDPRNLAYYLRKHKIARPDDEGGS